MGSHRITCGGKEVISLHNKVRATPGAAGAFHEYITATLMNCDKFHIQASKLCRVANINVLAKQPRFGMRIIGLGGLGKMAVNAFVSILDQK